MLFRSGFIRVGWMISPNSYHELARSPRFISPNAIIIKITNGQNYQSENLIHLSKLTRKVTTMDKIIKINRESIQFCEDHPGQINAMPGLPISLATSHTFAGPAVHLWLQRSKWSHTRQWPERFQKVPSGSTGGKHWTVSGVPVMPLMVRSLRFMNS